VNDKEIIAEWAEKIQAAVSTLTEDLGKEYEVRIDMERDIQEDPINPSTDGYRNFIPVPGSERATITIYPKDTIRNMADFKTDEEE